MTHSNENTRFCSKVCEVPFALGFSTDFSRSSDPDSKAVHQPGWSFDSSESCMFSAESTLVTCVRDTSIYSLFCDVSPLWKQRPFELPSALTYTFLLHETLVQLLTAEKRFASSNVSACIKKKKLKCYFGQNTVSRCIYPSCLDLKKLQPRIVILNKQIFFGQYYSRIYK